MTQKEYNVIRLREEGSTIRQISDQVNLSTSTVHAILKAEQASRIEEAKVQPILERLESLQEQIEGIYKRTCYGILVELAEFNAYSQLDVPRVRFYQETIQAFLDHATMNPKQNKNTHWVGLIQTLQTYLEEDKAQKREYQSYYTLPKTIAYVKQVFEKEVVL